MKKLALILIALLGLSASTYAQGIDQVNGSVQIKSGPSAPLLIVDQTTAGQKIQSWRNNGTEKCYIDVSGNLNCAGTFTLTGQFLAADGSASAPSYSWASEPTSGLYRAGASDLRVVLASSPTVRFDPGALILAATSGLSWGSSTVTAADVTLSRGAANLLNLASGDSFNVVGGGGSYQMETKVVVSSTAPSAPVACTTPTVTWNTGTAAFQIDVGGTCAGITTLVVTLPAVTNAWVCYAVNTTTSATAEVEMTASTTTSATFTNYTRTTGIALAWVDGADIRIGCLGG